MYRTLGQRLSSIASSFPERGRRLRARSCSLGLELPQVLYTLLSHLSSLSRCFVLPLLYIALERSNGREEGEGGRMQRSTRSKKKPPCSMASRWLSISPTSASPYISVLLSSSSSSSSSLSWAISATLVFSCQDGKSLFLIRSQRGENSHSLSVVGGDEPPSPSPPPSLKGLRSLGQQHNHDSHVEAGG